MNLNKRYTVLIDNGQTQETVDIANSKAIAMGVFETAKKTAFSVTLLDNKTGKPIASYQK